MQYMLMIYEDEKAWQAMSDADRGVIFAEYGKFTEEIRAAGQYKSGAPLHPTATATSVRVRDGQRLVTDGPFAETREQLGGFYIVNAKDLDEAIAIASRIPAVRIGTIEVRPVLEMGAAAAS